MNEYCLQIHALCTLANYLGVVWMEESINMLRDCNWIILFAISDVRFCNLSFIGSPCRSVIVIYKKQY